MVNEARNLFEVRSTDRSFFQQRLRDFLPDRVVDVHTHVWLSSSQGDHRNQVQRAVTWPNRVASVNPIEDLQETYSLLFPGKSVTPLIFGNTIYPDDDLEAGNRYVSDCSAATGAPGLIFAIPQWTGEELERKIISGGFIGAKVYLTWADPRLAGDDIDIYDFLPPHQLEVLDQHSWVVMLHIPRSGRLRDRQNLSRLCEIDKRYPRAQIIVAHVGRAYCVEDVGQAFDLLSGTENLLFDISANTNSEVFEKLLRAIRSDRILFGSDLPISRMRMHRICEDGIYVNLVESGAYGDVSGDRNMREVAAGSMNLTFFLYEEIEAFRQACERTGIGAAQVENMFFSNAARIFERAGRPLPWTPSGKPILS